MKSAYGKLEKLKYMFISILLIEFVVEIGLVLSYFFFGGDVNSQKYILSAIFQGLAAILALTLTGVLVVSQMLADTYSHRVIKYFFNKWMLFFLIAFYLVSMFYPLMLLNNLSVNSTIDRLQMAQAISIALVSVAFSGIFIYFMLIYLRPQTIFEFLKKGIKKEKTNIKTAEEIFQVFSDIIIGAIYKYDVETVREGIKALTGIYIDAISVEENEKISYEFIEHLRRYKNIAKRQENGEALLEIVRNINTIMLEGHKRGKNPSIPFYFSRIVEEILSYSKSRDDGTFTVCVGEIRKSALKAIDMKREVTGRSYYLKHLISPLCNIEGALSKETTSPESFSQLESVLSDLYKIGKEYAESGKKELKEAIIEIVWALEENVEHSCKNEIRMDLFKMRVYYISDIIKTCIKTKMFPEVETMLMGMIHLIDEVSKDENLHPYLYEILEPFVPLCAGFKVRGEKERLDFLLDTMDRIIKDKKQRNLIKSYISACLEQGVFKSELEKMTHTEKEMYEYIESVRYILNELEKRWGS